MKKDSDFHTIVTMREILTCICVSLIKASLIIFHLSCYFPQQGLHTRENLNQKNFYYEGNQKE